MFIVALTGGIGSGKSTVVKMFEDHHVAIVDTDIIARQLLNQATPARAKTLSEFGDEITTSSGQIDREKLRHLIFNDDGAREKLQAILHPEIHQQTLEQLTRLEQTNVNTPYCIVVIPLLAESSRIYPQHRILLVDSSEALQIERSCARDQCEPELIKKIIANQASPQQRQAIADDVIDNNGDLDSLQKAVDRLHTLYTSLAEA